MGEEHEDIIAALRRRPGSTVEDLAAMLVAPATRDLAAELEALEAAGQARSQRVGSEREWVAPSAAVT